MILSGQGWPQDWQLQGGDLHTMKQHRNLTRQLGYRIKQTGQALTGLKTSLFSLANIVLDDRLALDFLLAEYCIICEITNYFLLHLKQCNRTDKVNIKEIYPQEEWLHNFGRSDITSTVWSTVREALPE